MVLRFIYKDPVTKKNYAYLGSAYQRFSNGSTPIEAQPPSNLTDNTAGRIDSTEQVSGTNTHIAAQPTSSLTDNTVNRTDSTQQINQINNTILEIYNKLFIVINNKNNQSLPEPNKITKNRHDGGDDLIDHPGVSQGSKPDQTVNEKPASTTKTISAGLDMFN